MLHAAYSAILCLAHGTYQDYIASTPSAGTGKAPDRPVGQQEMQAGLKEEKHSALSELTIHVYADELDLGHCPAGPGARQLSVVGVI